MISTPLREHTGSEIPPAPQLKKVSNTIYYPAKHQKALFWPRVGYRLKFSGIALSRFMIACPSGDLMNPIKRLTASP